MKANNRVYASASSNGMTVRDHLASMAMQGWIGNSAVHDMPVDAIARDAYDMADAMIAESVLTDTEEEG